MRLQAGISRACNERRVGRVVPVLIEGVSEESELLLKGRAEWQAPDVDGQVYIASPPPDARVGDIRPMRVTKAGDYDLVGELIRPSRTLQMRKRPL